jgi:hypothetical protein
MKEKIIEFLKNLSEIAPYDTGCKNHHITYNREKECLEVCVWVKNGDYVPVFLDDTWDDVDTETIDVIEAHLKEKGHI